MAQVWMCGLLACAVMRVAGSPTTCVKTRRGVKSGFLKLGRRLSHPRFEIRRLTAWMSLNIARRIRWAFFGEKESAVTSRKTIPNHESPRCLRSIFRLGVVCAGLAVTFGHRRHLVDSEVPIKRRQGPSAG